MQSKYKKLVLTVMGVMAGVVAIGVSAQTNVEAACAGVYNKDTSNCYPTVQSAIDTATPGETLNLPVGEINECQIIIDKAIRIVGKGGKTGDLSRESVINAEDCKNGIIISANDVSLSQFSIENVGQALPDGDVKANDAAIKFTNYGGGSTDIENIKLSQLRIVNSAGSGVVATNLTRLHNLSLVGSHINGVKYNGMRLTGNFLTDLSKLMILNNVIENAEETGLWLPTNLMHTYIKHNRIVDNGYDMNDIGSGTGVWIKENSKSGFPDKLGVEFTNNEFSGNYISLRLDVAGVIDNKLDLAGNFWGEAGECPAPIGTIENYLKLVVAGTIEQDLVADYMNVTGCGEVLDIVNPDLSSDLMDNSEISLQSDYLLTGSAADADSGIKSGLYEFMKAGVSLRVFEADTKAHVVTPDFKPWNLVSEYDEINETYSITIPAGSLDTGVYHLELTARDNAGRQTRIMVENVEVDVAPVVDMNIMDNDVISDLSEITASVMESSLFRYHIKLVGPGNVNLYTYTSGFDQVEFNDMIVFAGTRVNEPKTADLDDGSYTLTFSTRDEFGNKDNESTKVVNFELIK